MTTSMSAKSRRAPSAVVWNWIVPALGVALMLGAPVVPAIAIAAAASIALGAALAPQPRQAPWRRRVPARVAADRVLGGH